MIGVSRVMKGLGAAAILRVAIGAARNKKFGNGTLKRGGSHMKRRVAGVKVVTNFGEKEIWRTFAFSANLSRRGSKRGSDRQAAGYFVDLPIDDVSNEFKKGRLNLCHQFLIPAGTAGGLCCVHLPIIAATGSRGERAHSATCRSGYH